MKKILILIAVMATTLAASAQFEKGTHYAEASLTGFGIGAEGRNFTIGFGTGYGYYIQQNWMLGGRIGYEHRGSGSDFAKIQGLFRYTFSNCGVNLGAGLQYQHGPTTCPSGTHFPGSNFVQLCPQVGYTFYLSHVVSLEPSLYYDLCMNDFRHGSNLGLKLGIGLYYNKKK